MKDVAEMRRRAADLLCYLWAGEFKDRHLTARDPLTPIRESHESLSANNCEVEFVLGSAQRR